MAKPPISRKLTTGPTLGDQAYQAIREAITSGDLAAGERTTERALARRLGVSPTPVREALQRLEHERLIRRPSTRGIEVAKPTQRELYELAIIEAALRGVAARLAAEAATDAELAEIEAVVVEAENLVAKQGPTVRREHVLRRTRRFHDLVDRAAHNPSLEGMIATATAFDWDFRLHAMTNADPAGSVGKAKRHEEHRSILEALEQRDGPLAEELMRRHILSVTEAFLAMSADASSERNEGVI
jgi:DNA-binding GntR family transcriptional regulator